MASETGRVQRGRMRITLGILVLMALLWVMHALLELNLLNGYSLFLHAFNPEIEKSVIWTVFAALQLSLTLYVWQIMKQQFALEKELERTVQKLDEEKSRSEAILEAISHGISIQDSEFRVLYQNQAHRDIIGRECVGEYCYRAYGKKEKVCDPCPVARTLRDGLVHKEEKALAAGCGIIFVEQTASPLRDRDGKIIAGVLVVRDISKRKQNEEYIIRLNKELEARAGELAKTNSELEAFSYSLSHDLRTPLTSISISASALLENYLDQLDDNGRLFINGICEGSDRIERLIEAMLLLSRVNRSDICLEEVSLSALAAEAIGELLAAEPARQVAVAIDPDLTAFGDPQLLKVALTNLLGNAWKYSRHAPHPRIEFGQLSRNGKALFIVRDNGAGFNMGEADLLFTPFKRLHTTAQFPGTGIGLATVQRIIERHGGRVWAEGEPGKGAIFYFTLDRDAEPASS